MTKMIFFDNSYHISRKKPFQENCLVERDIIVKSFDFASEMAFGSGFHRNHRSGGDKKRNPLEIFFNTFQGKMGEFIVRDEFVNKKIDCSEVDINIFGKGIWDNGDLIINEKKICIKSMAFFSNLLLLEKNDWDENGLYLQNTDNKVKYDYFVAVRIKPNIKEIFTNVVANFEKNEFSKILDLAKFYYDIPGVMSSETLKHIIRKGYVIKKGNILNKKTILDADNYYIQNGDLKDFELLINRLTI